MPNLNNSLAFFKNYNVRRMHDPKTELWSFSVIDIIAVLTDQKNYNKAKSYWTTLKNRLKKEGSEVVTNCDRLKMLSQDGKMRNTDVATVETLLRLIQSVPSPKAEPIKLWLAKVGFERLQEIADPERSLNRARENWKARGRSQKWIDQRMSGQETHSKLTDYWSENGVEKGKEYGILTNIIHQEWSGLSVQKHKETKGLKSQNLRDHMSESELLFTALAEMSTRQIAETMETKGLEANKIPAKKGGNIAKNARLELESKTGKKVITKDNFLPIKQSTPKLK
jgi:DNA-damage-inducible protein D